MVCTAQFWCSKGGSMLSCCCLRAAPCQALSPRLCPDFTDVETEIQDKDMVVFKSSPGSCSVMQ